MQSINDLKKDPQKWIEDVFADFIACSPKNLMRDNDGEHIYNEALIGFSSGADPIYESYKEYVGQFHFTPAEIFNLTFPEAPATPDELTVISWVLPQSLETKQDNRTQDFYPADRWVFARFLGGKFGEALRQHVVAQLEQAGVLAVAPGLSPHWQKEMSTVYGLASRWSERHAAYACGLGTFGLCDGLITAKGKAHSVGTVVARTKIQPTLRPYRDHHAYCLYFYDGSCMACVKRCPAGAITETGHDKMKCWSHAGGTCARYIEERFGFKGYGCGLCQTGVPCESGIPQKILKNNGLQNENCASI